MFQGSHILGQRLKANDTLLADQTCGHDRVKTNVRANVIKSHSASQEVRKQPLYFWLMMTQQVACGRAAGVEPEPLADPALNIGVPFAYEARG
jgi:hypothetical protein